MFLLQSLAVIQSGSDFSVDQASLSSEPPKYKKKYLTMGTAGHGYRPGAPEVNSRVAYIQCHALSIYSVNRIGQGFCTVVRCMCMQ